MSNIYVLEPPTSGKVLLKTTVGDIDIELWSKETPRTCRNFVQLCLEGYYDNTIFHRIVKGFIAQGGDPSGDGTGGESIYGEPFKDEFHQRLRFTHRGILAMANSDKDDNGSQFFFTLAPTPELQNKHTIFGKVTGNTIFNMLKLEEGLIEDERPVYPHKILKTEVLFNPFGDIEPREKTVVKEKKKKEKQVGVKNFKLLSFGEEAEEDEEETMRENEKFSGKSKSTHDVLDDPKLLGQTDEVKLPPPKELEENSGSETDHEEQLENIRKKLKAEKDRYKVTKRRRSYDDDEIEEKQRKREEIKKEIEEVKREYHKNKLKREQEKTEEDKKETERSDTIKEYKDEYDKYKEKKKTLPKKGATREQFTLELLAKFKRKLSAVKNKDDDDDDDDDGEAGSSVEAAKLDEDDTWMSHQLHFKDDAPVLAKDANTKDDDWFEIYDPRNPINKRRRGENTNKANK